jgi:putative tryptophan/tyrosine transport system substrate-binding protein
MRRRDFIARLGGAAAAWPLAARAQQPGAPVIGYLGATTLDSYASGQLDGFRQGLADAGLAADRSVGIEARWAEGRYDRLPALADELLSRGVTLILASSLPSALAAKQITSTTPIVFVMGADPVKLGVVASLNRPGGNVTGIYQYYGALGGKRLELIRELVPSLRVLAILSNPQNPNAEDHLKDIQTAARVIGLQLDVLRASSESDIEGAFADLAQHHDGALLVADDPDLQSRRDQIVALAAQRNIPTSYYSREFALVGGLMSYGSSTVDNYRQAGDYAGRILKGEKPADLPIKQPTKFELVINVKTAKKLGLTVPASLLATADEVIE